MCNPLFLRRHKVDGHVHHAHGGAARRRERRLRAFLRHEQPLLAMQTATVPHHSWRRAGRADASTQTVSYSAPAPVVEHAAPAPVFEYAAPAPVHADFLEPPVPIVQVAKVPQVQVIEKSTRFSKSSLLTTPQTSESLGTTPVRPVTFAETVDTAEVGSPLLAEPVHPTRKTTPVVDAPLVVAELVQPAPVVELAAPASAVTCAALAPVVEYAAPALRSCLRGTCSRGRICRTSTSICSRGTCSRGRPHRSSACCVLRSADSCG